MMQSHDVVEVHTSVFFFPSINQSKTCIHLGHHIITQVYQKEERFSETKMAGGHKSRKGLE